MLHHSDEILCCPSFHSFHPLSLLLILLWSRRGGGSPSKHWVRGGVNALGRLSITSATDSNKQPFFSFGNITLRFFCSSSLLWQSRFFLCTFYCMTLIELPGVGGLPAVNVVFIITSWEQSATGIYLFIYLFFSYCARWTWTLVPSTFVMSHQGKINRGKLLYWQWERSHWPFVSRLTHVYKNLCSTPICRLFAETRRTCKVTTELLIRLNKYCFWWFLYR